jgi:Fe-Mn family superoxide dismutase
MMFSQMKLTKRDFCKALAALGTLGLSGGLLPALAAQKTPLATNSKQSEAIMAFTLPDLPYAQNALEPYISANTLSIHHGKHHKAYVDNLNKMVAGTDLEGLALEEIIKKSAGNAAQAGIFNNSAQIWNHTFYWHSMKPAGGGAPTGAIAAKIDADFGSFDKFKEEFKTAGATQFGSGWAWLVLENGKLKVTKTGNADLPMAHGQTAILTMDVWEHAYYIDFQNRRPDYISTFLDSLVNWDFANENLAKA